VSQLSAHGVDAHLNLHAAYHVQASTLARFQAAVLAAASPHEIELARAAYLSAADAVLDRSQDVLFAKMIEDGIDPHTRRPLRR
jgi:hypothetical protein